MCVRQKLDLAQCPLFDAAVAASVLEVANSSLHFVSGGSARQAEAVPLSHAGVLISKRSQIFDGVIFQVKLASKDIIKEYDQCKALSLAKDARRCHDTEC